MIKALLTFAPALVWILFVSSHKSSLFGNAPYQVAAERLLSNHEYLGDINYDERAFQKMMAQRLPHDITTLVAGSSRTMQLNSACFEGKSYNASVSGAMLSDVAAIIEQFRRGRQLQHVVLSADPWMLNGHEQKEAWTNSPAVPNLIRIQAAPDWINAQLRLGLTPHKEDFIAAARAELEPLRGWLAPATFQAALYPKPTPVSGYRKRPDGSLLFPERGRTTAEVAALAQRDVEGHLAQTYVGFDQVDPFLAQAFTALVAQLGRDGARVTLVLAPFHPVYYKRAEPLLKLAEEFYLSIEGVERIGTYDPVAAHTPETFFLDGVHLSRAALNELYGCPVTPTIL